MERGQEGLILLLVLLLLPVGLPILFLSSLRMGRAEGEREERLFTGEDW